MRSPVRLRTSWFALGTSVAALTSVLTATKVGHAVNWVRRGYDQKQTGANTSETLLTQKNVNVAHFGKLFSLPVDDNVYAQPLYVAAVQVPSRPSGSPPPNVVYASTVGNKVYAFNADTGAQLWVADLNNGFAPPTTNDLGGGLCTDLAPHKDSSTAKTGIVGTPVIDPVGFKMYVAARTLENGTIIYRLWSLDIRTGASTTTPVVVNPGTSTFPFDAAYANNRASLALSNGVVYVAFGSNCDHNDTGNTYLRGWLVAYNATTLAQTAWFSTTGNGGSGDTGIKGGIWQAGGAPAFDDSGNGYFTAGDGTYSSSPNDYGDSVVKFNPTTLVPTDSFTPSNYANLLANDLDLGSASPVILPGTRNTIVQRGKPGNLEVMSLSGLGGVGGDRQSIPLGHAGFGSPVAWVGPNGVDPLVLYIFPSGADPYAIRYSDESNQFSTSPFAVSTAPATSTGGVLSLSANGSRAGTGILWAGAGNSTNGLSNDTLFAFNSEDLSVLWESDKKTKDAVSGARFNAPMIANGKVYVGTYSQQVAVYGRIDAPKNDVDGNGLSDVMLTGGLIPPNNNQPWGSLPVAFMQSNGTLSVTNDAISNFGTWATQAWYAVSGDFNGDRLADIALAGYPGWTTIPVALSNGDGTFTVTNQGNAAFPPLASQNGAKVIAGDFNGDGQSDLAVTGYSGLNYITVAFSTGIFSGQSAGFPYVTQADLGATPNFATFAAQSGAEPVVGDFNGDGMDDIALTCGAGWGSIPVAFSNGDGSFHWTNIAVSSFPGWSQQTGAKPVAGDFDNDGLADIALTGGSSSPGIPWGSVPVAFSTGTGGFTAYNAPITGDVFGTFATQQGARPVSGDFDGNGLSDVALTGGSSSPGVPWGSIPIAYSRLSQTHNSGSFNAVNTAIPSAGPPFGTFATQMGARPVDVMGPE